MHYSILKYIIEGDIKGRTRILIVDDDPDITLTFNVGLEKNRFVVSVFNDPLKALSKFTVACMTLYSLMLECPR